jgi:hypothetical protein
MTTQYQPGMFYPAYNGDMQLLEHLGPRTIGRVEKQGELLLKVYLAERAKDPSSQATKSSRSNGKCGLGEPADLGFSVHLRNGVTQSDHAPFEPGRHFRR